LRWAFDFESSVAAIFFVRVIVDLFSADLSISEKSTIFYASPLTEFFSKDANRTFERRQIELYFKAALKLGMA
jgi:hypothetical protein